MKSATSNINDYLSFVICLLQLKAFSHIMSDMTTKSIIYGVIDLRISYSVLNYANIVMHAKKLEV
jgi:hypothetical protein